MQAVNKLFNLLSKHFFAFTILALTVKTVAVMLVGFHLSFRTAEDIMLLVLAPLGSSLVLVLISSFIRKRWRQGALFVIQLLATGVLYANLLYYRFYIDFVTLSVLLQLNNVGGLGPSTVELFSPFDLLLFLDLIVIGLIAFRKSNRSKIKCLQTKRYAQMAVIVVAATFGIGLLQHPNLLRTTYDRNLLVRSLGLYHYQLINMIHGIKDPFDRMLASKTDAKAVEKSLYNDSDQLDAAYGAAKGRNVVLISLESTQNFVINRKLDGEEITPFLNELIKESYYFNNIYDQTAQGKTSDAEFMIDTGLYPLPSGSVFVRRPTNTFQSLPRILKKEAGYDAYVFHANDASFWNRDQAYQTLGYKRFFSKPSYDVNARNSVNYGLKDEAFLEQTIPYMKELKEPYLAKLLMLTNHFPFLLDTEDQQIAPAETKVGVVNRYIATVGYQDKALRQFFKQLKDEGLYENSIFVIYGDHYGISRKYESGIHELLGQEGTPLEHLALQQIPLIIHLPGQKGKTIQTIGGEVDIRATLMHLLGTSNGDYPSYSRNLFERKSSQPVVFRDGSMVSRDYAYLDHVCYERISKQEVPRRKCAPHLEDARKQLSISDKVIMEDLFRFTEK